MKFKVYIIFFIFFYFSIVSKSQNKAFQDWMKSEHIYNFSKFIKWENDNEDYFSICVFGDKDSSMFLLLSEMQDKRKIRGKEIITTFCSDIEKIENTNVLVLNRESNHLFDKIFDKTSGFNTLLFTDSCKSRNIMINFFPENKLKKVDVNERNIKERQLKINPLLFTIAAKYQEDWEDMYLNTKSMLDSEIIKVENQKIVLSKQQKEIEKKLEHIETLSDNINYKNSLIDSQKEDFKILLYDIKNQKKILDEKVCLLYMQTQKIKNQNNEITEKEIELKLKENELFAQTIKLQKHKSDIKLQENLIKNQKNEINDNLKEIKKQQLFIYFAFIVIILVLIMLYFIYQNYKTKKAANKRLEIKNSEITQQKEEIETQRDEIEAQRDLATKQRDLIAIQKEEITDSIKYASKIQNAILPPKLLTDAILSEYFIFFRPKDIVSGDFYWLKQSNNISFIAVADCTGHGVPGAFMSMLGNAFLNEIFNRKKFNSANQAFQLDTDFILNELREMIIKSLHQTGKSGESKDGMDISLIKVDTKAMKCQFSGANNPMYLIRRLEDSNKNTSNLEIEPYSNLQILESPNCILIEIKPDKMPIGLHYHSDYKSFTSIELKLYNSDIIYLLTDGIVDQFGGKEGKKFKKSHFKELIISIHGEPLASQKQLITAKFEEWKGDFEQVDDICVMGFKL